MGFRDVLLREIDAEEDLGLLVEHRLSGVHVLAHRVIIEKLAGAKADDVAGEILDGPDEAAMEHVDGAALAHFGQAGLLEFLEGEAHADEVLSERVPALGSVAALEVVNDLLGEAAVEEEISSRRGLGGFELLAVEVVGCLVRLDKALAQAWLFLAGGGGATLIGDLVADLLGDGLDGLGESELFHLHEEVKDVAALARGEAVIVAALRAHVERGGALIFERAQPLHRVVASRL